MNALGIALVWCAAQVTLVAAFTALVYVIAYRAAPAARAVAIQTSLLVCAVLTGLALSPWPRWLDRGIATDTTKPSPVATSVVADDSVTTTKYVVTESEETPVTGSPTPIDLRSPGAITASDVASAFWNDLTTDLQRAPSPSTTNQRSWPEILAVLFLTGAGLALLRVALGVRAVGAFRRLSAPISDRPITELVDVVCAELSCRRKVQVCESGELATPATTGWLRPVIFLPAEWRSWDDAQCRAVLAHEIAHIDRNDSLTSLFARIGVALHFYHPLLHWLMRRLTLEQELAADAAAARVAGGQRAYLMILAEMALAQSNRPVRWPARTFLPTRGTFLRRIEMLRDSNSLSRSVPRGVRALAVGIMLMGGVAAAGFRAPTNIESADIARIPSATEIQPNGIAAATTVANSLPESAELQRDANLVTVKANVPDSGLVLAQATGQLPANDKTAHRDADRARSKANLRRIGLAMHNYHELHGHFPSAVMMAPDGKTPHSWRVELLPLLDQATLYQQYKLDEPWDSQSNKKVLAQMPDVYRDPGDTSRKSFSSYYVVAGTGTVFDPAKPVKFRDITDGTSNTLLAVEAKREIPWTKPEDIPYDPDKDPPKFAGFTEDGYHVLLVDGSVRFLAAPRWEKNQLKYFIERDDGHPLTVPEDAGRNQRTQVEPLKAPQRTDAEARRATSKNNLKRIALAMHNYHDVNRHFPSAVVMGPDGKTPHSWRVALLPYLEEPELFNEYKMDEPWDSETNKKVLAKMPAVFRHPSDKSDKPHSSYYVLVGKGTIFEGKGVRIRDIKDGTTNTIMAVEAKRDIPWTKPEDIPYDHDKDPPAFGGFDSEGYNAAFADGRVRFLIPTDWKNDQIKNLIEMNDRHIVRLPD